MSSNKSNAKKKSILLLAGLSGLVITGVFFHVLRYHELHSSALFYIAVPVLLAYIFIRSVPSKSNTGAILKGTTIVMLLSGPILQEGFICIIMAAPIFYIIGGIIGTIMDYRVRKKNTKIQSSVIAAILLLLSLEGTHPALTFDRNNTVIVEAIVNASVADVVQQIDQPINLGADVPAYLKLFPFPTNKEFNGNQIGDVNVLNFVYNKHFYFNTVIGDLRYKIINRGDNFIESVVVSDGSYLNTYLNWKNSKVSWKRIDDTHTSVTWEIRYERKLDPAWYFGTLQEYTMNRLAEALIQYSATPIHARY